MKYINHVQAIKNQFEHAPICKKINRTRAQLKFIWKKKKKTQPKSDFFSVISDR